MIDLHFTPTPNGQKISIALEEVGLPYRLISYDIFEGHQHTAEFGKINPNHRLPAIVDHDPPFGGAPHAVFESGAILQYIAETTGRLLPTDARQRSVAIQWLTWQVASLGPMGGQAAHFMRYAPERIDYAIERYGQEVVRLTKILERRLGEAAFLAGDDYSIADIAVFPSMGFTAADAQGHPNIHRWHSAIAKRDGVIRGLAADRAIPAKYMQRRAVLTPEQWSNLFGERMRAAVDL